MTRPIRLTLPLALLALVSCSSGPEAGEVVMELVTPSQDLGAIAFTLTAAQPEVIDTVRAACSGCRLDLRRRSPTQVDGVVTGSLAPGALLRVGVSNVKVPQAYAAQVRDAARRDYTLTSVTTVSLEIPRD